MNNKLIIGLMFCLVLTLFIGQASAWTSSEFVLDSEKILEKVDTTTKYGTYKIEESSWYDPLQIWTKTTIKEIDLKNNTDICGGDIGCLSSGTIVLNKDGTLIDELIWKRSFDEGKTFVDWTGFTNWKFLVEEDVDVFETTCKDGKEIIDEKNGTSYFEQDCITSKVGTEKQYKPLDFKKEYKAGTYNYKIEGNKKPNVIYDWIIKTNGEILDGWAVWGPVEDFSIYPIAQYRANTQDFSVNNQTQVLDTLGINNGTLSGKTFNDGTVSGGVTIEDGAMKFDGVNGKVTTTITSNDNFNGTDGFTIVAWVNRLGAGGGNGGRVVDKGTGTGVTNGFGFFMRTGDRFRFNINGSQLETKNTPTVFENGGWRQIAVTVLANGTARAYYDGQSLSWTNGETANTNPTNQITNTDGLVIGNLVDGTGRSFNGSIDDVLIFNRALSQDEITQLYNQGRGSYATVTDGLVAQYSGRDYAGESSAPTTIYDTNHLTEGKVNQGLSFDGVDDYVTIYKDTALDIGQDVSWGAWIKASSTIERANILNNARAFGISILSGKIRIGTGDGLGNIGTSYNINNNQWYHVFGTYNGSTMTMYLDGDVYGTASLSSITYDLPRGLTISKRDDDNNGYFFNGSIDDVRIYNRSLSEEEIRAIYNEGLGTEAINSAWAILNSPTNNSIQYTNSVTLSASANVTGGAYLVNATLYDNSTGSWGARNTTNLALIGGEGLVSYYKLDETSGTTAYDSLLLYNLTNEGATVNQVGKINKSYLFDGSNDYLYSTTPQLNNRQTRSIGFWIYPTESREVTLYRTFTTTDAFMFGYLANNSIKMEIRNKDSPSWITFVTSNTTINQNQWNYINFVYDNPTRTGIIYLNGVNVGVGTHGVFNSGEPTSDKTYYFKNAFGSLFKGYGDEVGIWNRSLTQSEITQLYNSGAGRRPMKTTTTTTFTNTYSAGDVVDWNMKFCDSDGDCGQAVSNYRFSIPFYENSRLYNTTTYETKNETFSIDIENSEVLDNVYLNYNGIDYLTTKSGDIYSKTLPMELVATDTNRTFYYKFEYAGTNITSPTSIQLVKNYLVNWTGTKQYINITIKDEYDNTIINSTTMDTLFDYYIDKGGYTNIHQEIKTEDGIFGFSATPNIDRWSGFGRLYYYATGYQPRYFFIDDEEFTNSTITQKTLYLLLQTDGILARYKIYDTIGNELENVRVSAYKKVGNSEILVEQVLTDSLGEASLFLNPNYYHRILITNDGCTIIDRTRRITSSDTYTEFMTCGKGGGSGGMNLTTFENVTSSFSPYSTVQYTNNTVTFSFTSTDSNCNLDETTYILKFGGTNLISLTGNNPCGQTLSQSVNLENYSGTLVGYGIMKIGDSQITLTKQYTVLNIGNVVYNQTSVGSLLDKLKDPTFGLELGLSPTTKALICFLILFGLIASFGNLTNKDNIPIMLVLVCLFLFVCSYMNFLTVFNSDYDWLNQYGILLLVGIFTSGVVIRRYA